jgi:succinoglycan biosynthesis transport protein ExoP
MTDLSEIAGAVRRSWWLVLAVTVLCAAGALAYTKAAPKQYESHLQLFANAQSAKKTDLQSTYEGGLFAQQRMQSYTDLARSPLVLSPVITLLSIDQTPTELARDITAIAPPGTVLLNITVTRDDAQEARRIAAGVGARLVETVSTLEKPSAHGLSQVKLSESAPASLPTTQSGVSTLLAVIGGVALGLLIGLLAALLRGQLDTRVRAPQAAAVAVGTPLLGSVPHERGDWRVGHRPVASRAELGPAQAEALRHVRTMLRYLDPDQPPRSLLLTSAMPGEGKTTIAIGLARAFAQSGADVILVDADLRRPRIATALGLPASEGLIGALFSSGSLLDALQPWEPAPGSTAVRVLAAGPVPPNPSELLGSQRMLAILAGLRAQADIVIVDGPPLLPVTDAAVLAPGVDGVLLVARPGVVRRNELEQASQILTSVHARLLGMVANAVNVERDAYGYGAPAEGDPVAAPLPATQARPLREARGA